MAALGCGARGAGRGPSGVSPGAGRDAGPPGQDVAADVTGMPAEDVGRDVPAAPVEDAGRDAPAADVPGTDAVADAGAGQGCAAWAEVADDGLLVAIHGHLSATYAPIEPAPDLGGRRNRYTTARRLMFAEVERFTPAGGGSAGVECVYTGRFVATAADREPDDEDVNCEHTWPRSRMDPDEEGALYAHQQSDIHHLFPSDTDTNSARGNLRFGEPVSDLDRQHAPALIGLDAAGGRVFEPRPERRGDVARAILYFSARWGADVPDDEEAVLRRWAADDPVDSRERRRNDAVQALQGNRNPLVDCPALVGRIGDFVAFPIYDGALPLP